MPIMRVVSLVNYATREQANAAAKRARGHGTTATIRKNGPLRYPYSVVVKRPEYKRRKG